MDKFRIMKTFVLVAEGGSFTAAAQHLNTTTGYISRSITDLETHLRTRLLNRTTRRIALTEAGERYLSRCVAILDSIEEAEAEASDAHSTPVGVLRVHAMSSVGQNYVVPAVAAYQERYPSVTVDLTLSQSVPDLIEENYDVALRVSRDALPDSNYVSHNLGVVHSVLCASPSYLAANGEPKTVKDLAKHTCLQLSLPVFPKDRWVLVGPHGERSVRLPDTRFKVNVPDALIVALAEGMGIGALPTLAVRSSFLSGALVRVLPDYHLQQFNIYAVYASRQYVDAKIKTWVEFLRGWVTDALKTDEKDISDASPKAGAGVRARKARP
jgi:DNA-binding transcriptional LysR family regulator